MEFRLTYAGKLLAHRNNKQQDRSLHVHEIRKEFHQQLRNLWKEHPVLKRGYPSGSHIPDPETMWGETINQDGFIWKPIVTERNGLICALDILMLREGRPGEVRADMDNRLKTLFDALRMAKNSLELGEGTKKGKQEPESEEYPFYVLLEDDRLITHISVTSDMLLEPVKGAEPETAVRLVINVTVRPYNVTINNADFVGS